MPTLYWHMLLYLVPSAIIALGLTKFSGRMHLFAFLILGGTVAHELSHLILGILLGAQPVSFNVWPRKTAAGYRMGHVAFTNIRWWNAAPVALSPTLLIPVILGVAWWRVRHGYQFDAMVDTIAWIALAPQLLSCWPSRTDWRLALRSWPLLLIGAAVAWYKWA